MEKENKTLNLCEKLAGCPVGTKLWSPLFGECMFVKISGTVIIVDTPAMAGLSSFDKHGHYFSTSEECLLFPSRENRDWDSWECQKPKVEVERFYPNTFQPFDKELGKRFDPTTLQPFDKVLVRDSDYTRWSADFFAIINQGLEYPVRTVVNSWRQAVPYNENTKHLLGTKDEAPEYYRWWEDKA